MILILIKKGSVYHNNSPKPKPSRINIERRHISDPPQLESILKLVQSSNDLSATNLELSFVKYFEERFAPKQTSQENLGVRIQTKYVLTEDMVRKEIERINLEKDRKIACTEEAKKERIRKKNLIEAEEERN